MIIKCKMCGGDIQFNPGDTCGQCDHCGCTTTFPKLPDEQRANLFNRANHFRRQCEFDKAMTAYEHILEVDDTDAEAHWGIVLSKFGIEYVEDPVTLERIPTCHRAQVISILSDEDYQNAIKYASDTQSREIYEQEAKRIAEIQKGILAISSLEEPYDVFICYKETDENGNRTKDSALAQEIYYQLTNEGYKVFFSRITLEDKLGQEYEPYIFAALNSAKVMLVVGTKPENFSAVWVKNEWSRFLTIMKNDRKRVLIPCYRDMDPYDLPEELSTLQSQDMSKIGFVQDLIRGINKVLETKKETQQVQGTVTVTAQTSAVSSGNSSTATSLLKRARVFLEDNEWDKADEYADKVLDMDVESAEAYVVKMLAERHLRDEKEFEEFLKNPKKTNQGNWIAKDNLPIDKNYQKAVRFGSASIQSMLENWVKIVDVRRKKEKEDMEKEKRANVITELKKKAEGVTTVKQVIAFRPELAKIRDYDGANELVTFFLDKAEKIYADAYQTAEKLEMKGLFDRAELCYKELGDYLDSAQRAEKCLKEAMEVLYQQAQQYEKDKNWDEAIRKYNLLTDYKDSRERKAICTRMREEQRQEKKKIQEQQARITAAKKKRNIIFAIISVLVCAAAIFVVTKVIIPGNRYQKAIELRTAGQYEESIKAFSELGAYNDSVDQITETRYQQAKSLNASGKYDEAYIAFASIIDYKDVNNLIQNDNNLSAAAHEAKIAPYKMIGNVVTFGNYEQDNNVENGHEEIEWIVLDTKGNKSMLLSKNGLDTKKYNSAEQTITWEECSLRTWLNKDFLKEAFTTAEQSAILMTITDNSPDQGYNRWKTSGGDNTQDLIFLLSYAEANKYLGVTHDNNENAKSRVSPSIYAKKNGAATHSASYTTTDGEKSGWWWLRSPGELQHNASIVYYNGAFDDKPVVSAGGCVRPSFWINLDSDIFYPY